MSATLGGKAAAATIAVKDFAAARKFYEEVLGLKVVHVDEETGVADFMSGPSNVLVYRSEFAGTNKATSATWGVGDDLEAIVTDLQARGVAFEHYRDLPGLTLNGEIHEAGDFKGAWFKDPDGNILHIHNM